MTTSFSKRFRKYKGREFATLVFCGVCGKKMLQHLDYMRVRQYNNSYRPESGFDREGRDLTAGRGAYTPLTMGKTITAKAQTPALALAA